MLAWCIGEALLKGKASMLGAASGAVAGLVAITPAAGNVGIMGALVVGAAAGFLCLWGVNGLKKVLGADDSLDVFGVHGVGGIIGALLTGVFADAAIGGAPGSLAVQALGVVCTLAYSGIASALILWLVDALVGLRVTRQQEAQGLDLSQHGERVE